MLIILQQLLIILNDFIVKSFMSPEPSKRVVKKHVVDQKARKEQIRIIYLTSHD